MSERTWKDNAAEFGALTRQGYGVRLAILVACSVESGASNGRPAKTPTAAEVSKVSASAFARAAEVSERTVARYLDKWDRLVAAGWDLNRSRLAPVDAETLAVSDEFVAEFDALASAGKADSGLTGKAADIASNPRALATALRADPALAATAASVLASTPHGRATAAAAINEADRANPIEVARPSREATQSALLFGIRRVMTDVDGLVSLAHEHGDRLTEPESEALLNLAGRLRATGDALASIARGESLDSELAELLGDPS